jgi:BirA family biotin operon repressor/biotin-[acetyl-CoA-carboxylase] ligase
VRFPISDFEKLPLPRETLTFDQQHIGRQVDCYDSVTSTNDLATLLSRDPDHHGRVIVAEHQTAGRGQYGRVWQSRPGSSLLMSVLVFPPPELRRPVILTAWAAVAVGDAILALTGVQARIKWPNDLLIRGQKVCGILIEQSTTAGSLATSVGIGLNLNRTADEFIAAGLPEATALSLVLGSPVDPRRALGVVLRHLDDEYARLLDGERVPLESDWKWRVGLLGRHVVAELTDQSTVSGRLREMSFDGIELETGEGFVALAPESIRQLRPMSGDSRAESRSPEALSH